jgi:PIN domain nuclease of toxin-antitoxin system
LAEALVLDTTYLLPVFGIDIGLSRFETRFPEILEEYDARYNPVSLVEAKWISLRMGRYVERERFLERYRSGLMAIMTDKRISQTKLTDSAIEHVADRLLTENGVKDYFDRMIYATAAAEESDLLTEDKALIELEDAERKPAPRRILSWKVIVP